MPADQKDVIAANASMLSEIKSLEAQLTASGKSFPACPQMTERNDLAYNDALTAHKALLIGLVSMTKASPGAKAKPQTLTEKVLAAKGVKTLAELHEKHAPNLD